ncbi:MAG: molybdenum cofactor guanylyltransferase [Bacteroidota bacterium]
MIKRIRPLYALIVCGGKSQRMGMEKCLLDYHGLPQWKYIYDITKEIAYATLISCNSEQTTLFPPTIPKIIDDDKFGDIGPMKALLTAFEKYTEVDFLVIGCDYPFILKEDINSILEAVSGKDENVAAYNNAANKYEPMIAIYNKGVGEVIKERFANGDFSLQNVLWEVNAHPVNMRNDAIRSADTPQQFLAAKQILDDDVIKNNHISEKLF